MEKFNVGIIGATGMVGQRFITLLEGHPWFNVTCLAASARSAGKPLIESLNGRWKLDEPIPERLKAMIVMDAGDVDAVAAQVDFVFCAVDMPKADTRALEEAYAKKGVPVVSNNSACRALPDVPMLIPEINAHHTAVIAAQRERLGTERGFIAVKPNCSIQSYVPHLTPLLPFGIKRVIVSTYQAISGASKTFKEWPEMVDNVIPYIGNEETKSEQEPLKIWGSIQSGAIVPQQEPIISAHCIRVAASDGHLASVFVDFERKPSKEEILSLWASFEGEPQRLGLPSAPKPFIKYFEEPDRPQTRLDRDFERGMGITAGRLEEDRVFDYKFIGLSHNTVRGAAGGGVLSAELLVKQGYITKRV